MKGGLRLYVLCVVEIADGEVNEDVVRNKARFVFGIGPLVEAKVTDAKDFKDLEQKLRPGGGGNVEIDIVESSVKLRIGEQVWLEKGLTLQQFVEQVKHRASEEKDTTIYQPEPQSTQEL